MRYQVLPIGGPGKALSAKEQGEMLFEVLGKEPKFISARALFSFSRALFSRRFALSSPRFGSGL